MSAVSLYRKVTAVGGQYLDTLIHQELQNVNIMSYFFFLQKFTCFYVPATNKLKMEFKEKL